MSKLSTLIQRIKAWLAEILSPAPDDPNNYYNLPPPTPQPDPEPPAPQPEPPTSGGPNPDRPGDYKKGFLWKPSGENSNALVVLLPPAFTGFTTKAMTLVWSSGSEQLRYSGVANGDREHYRAKHAGSSYAAPCNCEVTVSGNTWVWRIPTTGKRHDGTITPTVSGSYTPTPPEPEPEKPKHPTIRWNGTTEIRLNPDVSFHRLYIVTHTAPNGKKYDWRTGAYHRLMEMHKPVPAGNVIRIQNPAAIQQEGIIQVCCETMEMYKRDGTKYSWCWLLRPNKPVESWITYDEWQAGKQDGVVLPLGKDG